MHTVPGHSILARALRTAVALSVLAACTAHAGDDGSWPAELHAALAPSGIPREAVALYVQEVGADAPLLAWNVEQPMNPASTMKLVTTLAALEILGPAYVWQTEVHVQGIVAGDTLHGDLVFKGYGDPKPDLERFTGLLAELRSRGLRDIRGDLVLDRSHFQLAHDDPARFDNEPSRPYNVLPDALLFNYKSVRLQFVPEPANGIVRILPTPAFPQVQITNQLALAAGSCTAMPDRPQVQIEVPRLIFTGIFPLGCGEHARNFALLSPDEYALSLFRLTWSAMGGSFAGSVRAQPVDPQARRLMVASSQPLAEIIRDINKFSNNVMARQVFLTLSGAESDPATAQRSAEVVKEWLRRSGIEAPDLVLENGSGLSRIERISAGSLAQILLRGFASPLMPEYLASLPIAGIDGTLRRRLGGSPAAGQAHIKTGYLSGVRAAAGYVRDRAGRWLAVVAMINHPAAGEAQEFQDAFVEWAYLQGAENCCVACRRCTR